MNKSRILLGLVGTEFDANDLLAVVSQDLIVPLTTMTLLATRIKETIAAAGADASLQGYADRMLEAAAEMERLIRDLQVGTFAAEHSVTSRGHHDVTALIALTVEMFRERAARGSIALSCTPPASIVVRCDAARLFEAVAHLIEHSLATAPAGAALRISASSDPYECVVGVVAKGKDIPEAEFVAVGPYIARSIVEAHGGRMWVESETGVRSGFYFTLPVG